MLVLVTQKNDQFYAMVSKLINLTYLVSCSGLRTVADESQNGYDLYIHLAIQSFIVKHYMRVRKDDLTDRKHSHYLSPPCRVYASSICGLLDISTSKDVDHERLFIDTLPQT